MVSQCLTVSKTKFQHSVTTKFFFARFSVKALSLLPFCETLIELRIFGFFFSLVRRMSVKQRINLKFLVRLGKIPTEALNLLQEVYGDNMMSRTCLFEWHRRFKEGREEMEDDHRSGRRSTSRTDENVERVRQKVQSDRRLTVRMIADELGMNSERAWRIITEDLGMRKICAKMVPRLLNEEQKERRVQVCQDILEQLETETNLLKRVVTGDKSWIFEYDPLTKRQTLEWKSALSSRPKKARMFKSKTKVMQIAFFYVLGIHIEFLPQGQTINQHVYESILRRLMSSVREKRELWETRSWLLHHDNPPGHNALGIREFLAKNNIAVLEQPPYSPGLAPCDFSLFTKLKEVIKGTRFQDSEAIKTTVTRELRRNLSRSAWKRGRGDWKSAFEPMEITLKVTCCKIYLSNRIKHE